MDMYFQFGVSLFMAAGYCWLYIEAYKVPILVPALDWGLDHTFFPSLLFLVLKIWLGHEMGITAASFYFAAIGGGIFVTIILLSFRMVRRSRPRDWWANVKGRFRRKEE